MVMVNDLTQLTLIWKEVKDCKSSAKMGHFWD